MAATRANKTLPENFPFTSEEPIKSELRRFTGAVEGRIQSIEKIAFDFAQTEDQLREIALGRINNTLAPAIEKIINLTELGFLMVNSGSSVRLEEGFKTFIVPEGDQRDLFAPTAFVTVQRTSTTDDFAIAQVTNWDREHGELTVDIMTVFGDPGPHTDWQISATPGVSLATRQYWEQTRDARTDVVTRHEDITTRNGQIVTLHNAIIAMRDEIEADRTFVKNARDEAVLTLGNIEDIAESVDPANIIHVRGENTFEVTPRMPTVPGTTANDTQAATTAFVQAVAALLAPKDSPALTGAPTAPTAAAGTNTTQIATTAFVRAAVAALVGSSPATLDTLNELATALGNDPNFATTMANALGAKFDKTGGSLTGNVTITKNAPTINLDKTAGAAQIVGRKNGVGRWILELGNSVEETATDGEGSDFAIVATNNAGAASSIPLVINRRTGQATLSARPAWGGATPWDTTNFNPGSKLNAVNPVYQDVLRGTGTGQPRMIASRNVGWEQFEPNTNYGILGSMGANYAFYAGGAIGPSGAAIHLPYTGRYWVSFNLFARSDSTGRLALVIGQTRTIGFIQTQSGHAGDSSYHFSAYFDATAGEYIHYYCSLARVYAYTIMGHSDVHCYFLG